METLPDRPRNNFEKGQFVRLRDDIDEKELQDQDLHKGALYRILHVEYVGGGQDGAWLGPPDMNARDIEAFKVELLIGDAPDPRYLNVRHALLKHLQMTRLN